MDAEGLRAKQMVKDLPFREKVRHYWGYYKKPVIIILLSVIFIAWTAVQCINAKVYDMNIAMYTVRTYEDEKTDMFGEMLKGQIDEINGNGSKDVFIYKYPADIRKEALQPEEHAVYSKINLELSADDYQTYILDQPYLDYFERVYPEVIQSTVNLKDIPEIKEMLGIHESENLYLVTTVMYERSMGDKVKVAEHKNAEKLHEYFSAMVEN